MNKVLCISVVLASTIVMTSCSKTEYSVNSLTDSIEAVNVSSLTPEERSSTNEKEDYNARLQGAKIVSHDGKMSSDFLIRSLEDLESKSDCIIIGTVIEKEQFRDEDPELVEMGIQKGTTTSVVRVEKAYLGNDVREGDLIKIEEFCYMYDDDNGTTILSTLGPYYPAKKDSTYILFLSRFEGGHALYTPTSRWYGKYPCNDQIIQKARDNEEIDSTEIEYSKSVSVDQSLVRDIYIKYGN